MKHNECEENYSSYLYLINAIVLFLILVSKCYFLIPVNLNQTNIVDKITVSIVSI